MPVHDLTIAFGTVPPSVTDGGQGTTRTPATEPGSLTLREVIVGTISQPSETVTESPQSFYPSS